MNQLDDNELTLNAKVFQETLETLLIKTANMLERHFPNKYQNIPNAHIIFFTRIRITINTYNAIMWLTAETPRDPRRKPLLYAVAPLVRTLFEELIALLFILHDVPNLIISFNMTSYTELWLEREASQKYYSTIPKWQDYIDKLNKQLDNLAKKFKLTPNQASNPKKYIGRWTTPGKTVEVLKIRYPNSKAIPFMKFINTWMYRTLSGESHLDFRAMQRRGLPFTKSLAKHIFGEDNYKEALEENFNNYHKDMIWATFTLLLSIVSEIEGHFDYQMKEKANDIWTIFINHSDMAKDFYDWRYKQLLS